MTKRFDWKHWWNKPLVRGISAMAFMRYSTKAASLARLALVANFLTPGQVGSFGLALLMISITEVFTETGINILLLKSPQKLKEYLDTAWGVSLVRGLVIGGFIALSASFLAKFYNDPELTTLLYWSALIPVLRGVINPAEITFQQNLQFERESAFRIFLQFLDMISGFFFAVWLQSPLGLIYGVIVGVVAEVILSFALFRVWPNLRRFEWRLVGRLYHETKVIISNGIVNFLTENLDYIVVGKVLGTAGLGIYQTGYKVASAVTIDFGSLLGQTIYPIYARLHFEKKAIAPLAWKATALLLSFYVVVAFPMLIFTRPMVMFIFRKPEWLAIIPVIRILFISGMFKSLVTSWNPLSILANNLHNHVIIHIITSIVLVAGILILAPIWGVVGASVAVLIAVLVVQPYAWWTLKQALTRLDS